MRQLTYSSAINVIALLLDHLPDSLHPDDKTWEWCWNELSDRAQDSVQNVRREAIELLKVYSAHDQHNGKKNHLL